jgi:cytochrome c-type biogenesis protein CcmH
MKSILWFVAFTLLLGMTATIVSAQDLQPQPVTDDMVNAVARQLYCPVCENIPLDVCPTQACAEWRDLIRAKLAEGRSAEWIKDYFAQQYGDRVLAQPPARGLNWLVYILPPVAILAGVYVLFRAFKVWRQPIPEIEAASETVFTTTGTASSSDEYIARLEEELKKY